MRRRLFHLAPVCSLRGVFAVVLALSLALPASGCQAGGGADAEPIAPSFEPVVLPHNQERRVGADTQERRRPGEDPGWEEKWQLASNYAAGGFDGEALAILDACLNLDPPAPWFQRMKDLKSSLRMRRAEETLLRIDSRGVKDYVLFGEPVDYRIRLRNVSGEEVTFHPPPAGTSGSALTLEVERVDRDVYSSELRRTWSRTFPLMAPGGAVLKIAPGGIHETTVRIPAEDVGPPIAGVRVLRVGGVLRPTGMRRGSEPRSVRIPVRAGRVIVLPPGYEPVAQDPMGSLRKAQSTAAATHLLLAIEFISARERPEAAQVLAETLAQGRVGLKRAALSGLALLRERAVGEPMAPYVEPLLAALAASPDAGQALMEGLALVSGQRLAPDARLWNDWWQRVRDTQPRIADSAPASASSP